MYMLGYAIFVSSLKHNRLGMLRCYKLKIQMVATNIHRNHGYQIL